MQKDLTVAQVLDCYGCRLFSYRTNIQNPRSVRFNTSNLLRQLNSNNKSGTKSSTVTQSLGRIAGRRRLGAPKGRPVFTLYLKSKASIRNGD